MLPANARSAFYTSLILALVEVFEVLVSKDEVVSPSTHVLRDYLHVIDTPVWFTDLHDLSIHALEVVAVVEHSYLSWLLVHCAFSPILVLLNVVALDTVWCTLIIELQLLLVLPRYDRDHSHLTHLYRIRVLCV